MGWVGSAETPRRYKKTFCEERRLERKRRKRDVLKRERRSVRRDVLRVGKKRKRYILKRKRYVLKKKEIRSEIIKKRERKRYEREASKKWV